MIIRPELGRRTILLLPMMGLLAACGAGEDEARLAELASRPSLEKMISHYQEMMVRLANQLSAELGPYPWEEESDMSESGCSVDFPPGTGGEIRRLRRWRFNGSIADADWPQAEEILRRTIGVYGFTPQPGPVNRPGRHTAGGVDKFNAYFRLGTQINTSMSVSTGCHYPEATRPPMK